MNVPFRGSCWRLAAAFVLILFVAPGRAVVSAAEPKNAVTFTVANTANPPKATATNLEFSFDKNIKMATSNVFTNTVINGGDITFDTPGPNTNGGVPFGTQVNGTVLFNAQGPYQLQNAWWTYPANVQLQPVPIGVPKVGLGGDIRQTNASPSGFSGELFLVNNDQATIYISNLQMSKDIQNSLFDDSSAGGLQALSDNNLYLSAGTHVSTDAGTGLPIPTNFSLLPGQEALVDLGQVDGIDYQAMQFSLSFSPSPSPTDTVLGFATDATVPEPGSIVLAGTVLALAVVAKRTARHRRTDLVDEPRL